MKWLPHEIRNAFYWGETYFTGELSAINYISFACPVKYEAYFTTDQQPFSSWGGMNYPPYDESSHMRELMIEWTPPVSIVDLNMDLCTGPDFGIYSATVDGNTLARGIEVEMTIFEDSLGGRRHETMGSMKIVPLNTGK